MNIPKNLKYTQDHEWVRVEGEEAYVGITEYAQGELGDVIFIEIETEGESLSKGDTFGTVEAVKTASDLFMPLTGEVLEANPILSEKPELVNSDPYGQGWMIKISVAKAEELDGLMDAEQYEATIA